MTAFRAPEPKIPQTFDGDTQRSKRRVQVRNTIEEARRASRLILQ